MDALTIRNNAKYDLHGINVESNNPDVVARNNAGFVVVQQTSSLLVIEGIDVKYTNASVIPLLNTRFEYFKFPVTVTPTGSFGIDFNIDDVLSTQTETIRLTLPVELDANQQPSEWIKTDSVLPSVWYYGGTQQSNGFKQIPFSGANQTAVNGYMITKDTLELLVKQNKTLKFTCKVQYQSARPTIDRAYHDLTLSRTNMQSGARNFNLNTFTIRAVSNAGPVSAQSNVYGVSNNAYPIIEVSYFVNMADTRAGDIYRWLTVSNAAASPLAGGWMSTGTSYWDIEIVDVPTGNYLLPGIYDIAPDNILYKNNDVSTIVAKRVASTNNQLIVTGLDDDMTNTTNTYDPFDVPGTIDGELRSAASGQLYEWNSETQSWRQWSLV